MPELPEVEVISQSLKTLENSIIENVEVYTTQLRYPIPAAVNNIKGQRITHITRRAKYIQIYTEKYCLLIHLGMSGTLFLQQNIPTHINTKHVHFALFFDDKRVLSYYDPRKFGACLIFAANETISLFAHLGPEPLSDIFDYNYFQAKLAQTKRSIKQVIMDNRIVVGVGNIYACESLFLAGILPTQEANSLNQQKVQTLLDTIKEVLLRAIAAGGTSFKDFQHTDGKPGYFQQKLFVYGRAGKPCHHCDTLIVKIAQNGRSSHYCPQCQK